MVLQRHWACSLIETRRQSVCATSSWHGGWKGVDICPVVSVHCPSEPCPGRWAMCGPEMISWAETFETQHVFIRNCSGMHRYRVCDMSNSGVEN